MIKVTKFKKVFICVTVLFIILGMLSFSYNLLNLFDSELYNHTYRAINQGVYGSMLGNKGLGFLNNYGLQTRYIHIQEDGTGSDISFTSEKYLEMKEYQKEQYLAGVVVDEDTNNSVYTSKVNLGGIVFSIMDRVLDIFKISQKGKTVIFHLLSTFLAISLFVIVGYWAYREFGIISGILIYVSVLFSYWLIPFGSGLSNSLFTYFLPFVTTLSILMMEKYKKRELDYKVELFAIFIAVTIKTMMGYELIPTVLVSLTVPYFYYTISDCWKIEKFIKRFVRASIAAISGVVFTIGVHITQLTLYFSDKNKAFETIMYSLGKRTLGNPDNFQEVYTPGLTASFIEVLKKYPYNASQNFISTLSLLEVTIICAVLFSITISCYFWIKKKYKNYKLFYRKNWAIIGALFISAIGTCSTLFLMRGHSYIHVKFSLVVFYLPLTIFVFAQIGFLLDTVLREVINAKSKNGETIINE